MDELLERGADSNAKDDDGIAVLMYAVVGGYKDEVDALLAAGANPNEQDADGRTVWHGDGAEHWRECCDSDQCDDGS